jgi:hypothetical protein
LEHFSAWNQIPTHVERWMPHVFPGYKFNFDTAIWDTFSAQAVVCRNHQGHIIHLISQISPPCLPNYGKALTARLATSLACSLNFNNFIIEGDSQVVISSLQHPQNFFDLRISPIIYDIIGSIPTSISWSARKANKSANFCAHVVAH